MFDLVHKHKVFAQVVLAMIALPFALFGTFQYFQSRSNLNEVAQIESAPWWQFWKTGRTREITQSEFDDALREQQERMRQALGRNYDPALVDTPEVRYALLDQLVNQRLLENRGRAERFRVSDRQLQEFIAGLPPFQEDGKFSATQYRQALAAQGMTPLLFEQRVREELALSPLQDPIVGGSFAAHASVLRYLGLLEQQREVAIASIAEQPFEKSVTVSDAEIKKFYDGNPTAFQTPEVAKIEYVMLSQDALMAQIKVDPAEVRQAYDQNSSQYSTAEERRASHILIAVKPDASDAAKAAARKKAEDLLAQAKANPAGFAELAKANSQDPGSAQQGGDLGSFSRGAMVKPFEDAVFAAKEGDIIGPVQTDFGFHVIKVTDITPPHVQSYDDVKGKIEADLKRQKAAQKFAAEADQFQNLVYEQADSLAGPAKALDLKIESTQFVTRSQVQALALGNVKFVQALFAPESLQGKRNTDAIEVGPNALMSGRIVEYKPAAPRPLAEVADQIRQQLTQRAASELAQKAGQQKLAQLALGKGAGDADVTFGKPVTLSRNQVQPGFSPAALKSIFELDARKVPAYTGATNDSAGYSIYRVERVIDAPPPDAAKLQSASDSVGSEIGRETMNAYLADLRAASNVKLNQAVLEKRPQ